MAQATRGEHDAFGEFVVEARARLLPRLRHRFPLVADDALSDALVKAFEQWPRFSDIDQPLAWVWTVAWRIANRSSQRDGRRMMLEALAAHPSMASPHNSGWLHDLVDALAALRPEHASALRLTQLEDLDANDAAATLGVSPGTVKVWVHRARRQLAARTAGVEGRWVSDEPVSPASLARRLCENGHRDLVDKVLPIVGVDSTVHWELHIAGGRYWLGTDDGARQDFGNIDVGARVLSTESIASVDVVDGERVPIPLGSNVGTSWHRFHVDGDLLHLTLVDTKIPATDGIPDEVFRRLLLNSITYRWVGHLEPLRAGGHAGVRLAGTSQVGP